LIFGFLGAIVLAILVMVLIGIIKVRLYLVRKIICDRKEKTKEFVRRRNEKVECGKNIVFDCNVLY